MISKFFGRLWGKYLVILPTTFRILSSVAITLLKMSSTPVSLPSVCCILLILSISHFQFLTRAITSFANLITFPMRFMGLKGLTRFWTKRTILLTNSANLLMYKGRNPASLSLNLLICSAITLVMLSNCFNNSSPASATA